MREGSGLGALGFLLNGRGSPPNRPQPLQQLPVHMLRGSPASIGVFFKFPGVKRAEREVKITDLRRPDFDFLTLCWL